MDLYGLTKDELQEVERDAAVDYVASGDRIGYALRLGRLGITPAVILENLRELDIRRAERFNELLARVGSRRRKDVA